MSSRQIRSAWISSWSVQSLLMSVSPTFPSPFTLMPECPNTQLNLCLEGHHSFDIRLLVTLLGGRGLLGKAQVFTLTGNKHLGPQNCKKRLWNKIWAFIKFNNSVRMDATWSLYPIEGGKAGGPLIWRSVVLQSACQSVTQQYTEACFEFLDD